jgi:hypothetical protein
VTFLAYLFAILKNAVYGTTVFFTSELTESTDVLDVLALRFLMSAVVFWLLKITRICKIRVGVKDFFQKGERRSALKIVLLTALVEPVLYMLFETLGVSSFFCQGVFRHCGVEFLCYFDTRQSNQNAPKENLWKPTTFAQ